MTNIMKTIKIGKVTLNVGAGKDQTKLDKAVKMIAIITGKNPVKTITDKRIAAWGLRKGLPIGCKLTLRGEEANENLRKLLKAKDDLLAESCFDNEGNISFGIKECIDIPGYRYDPAVGIMGLQVVVTLERPGFRVKRRSKLKARIPKDHRIKREEAIDFMKTNFNLKINE